MEEKDIINKLENIYNELSKEHDFTTPVPVKIVLSKRLRRANGTCLFVGNSLLKTFSELKIIMSCALLDEFGWERFEKTFRHEVAHIANAMIYNRYGHNYTFKMLCQKFKGSMNETMAGNQFKDCASTEFVKTIKKWRYVCSCGMSFERAKRISKKVILTHRCSECKKPLSDFVEIKI